MKHIFDIITRLEDCTEIITGRNVDKKKTNECGNGIPLIVGASDISQGQIICKRYVLEQSIKNPSISLKGDIILSIVGTLGKMGINTVGRCVLSGHVCAIRLKKGCSVQYIMAVISRLLLDSIPDTEDCTLGFQNKLDIEKLKQIEFVLPDLLLQEYIVSRMASITSIILAYKGEKEDFQSISRMIELIEQERKEQRAHFRKVSESLGQIADLLDNLPPDDEILEMIADARSGMKRLIKIQ